MIRLAIFGLLIFAFILLLRSFFAPSIQKGENSASIEEMVKDPNCETYIPKTESIKKVVHGTTHYFCSEKCAEEFSKK